MREEGREGGRRWNGGRERKVGRKGWRERGKGRGREREGASERVKGGGERKGEGGRDGGKTREVEAQAIVTVTLDGNTGAAVGQHKI